MNYKPLLLAILLSFSAPAFAADDSPKNSAKSTTKSKSTDKNTAKDKPAKDKPAKKAAAKTDDEAAKKMTKAVKSSQSKAQDAKAPAKKSKANDESKEADKRTAAKNDKDDDKRPSKTAPTKNSLKNKDNKDDKANKKAVAKQVDKNKENSTNSSRKRQNKETDKSNDKKAVATKEKDPVKENAKEKKERLKKEKAEAKEKVNREKAESKEKAAREKAEAKEKAARTKADNNNAGSKINDDMRRAIADATNEVENKQALNRRADALLIRVNTTLNQTRSNLSAINRKQRDAWDKFQELNTDLSRLKAEVSNMQAQISRFVSGNYKNSQPNAVALFLKKAEPGQKTRFLTYTRYINAANEKVVADLSRQQKALAVQEDKINAELVRLKKLQANAQAALKRQGVKDTAELSESRRQNAKMAKEAQKVVSRKDSEQRLNTLLADINKRKAEQRRKEAEARKKAAEARLAAAEKARKAQLAQQKEAEAERAALSNLTPEDMQLSAPEYVRIENPNSFSRMQGRLNKPVQGNLAGLFGHDRGDGEVWKGVFYQTGAMPVKAIATGTVVYAGNLEGYGNVVVIDHGDKYVSVYSGMSEISVSEGYTVPANSQLGISGKLPGGEEGLYLEIRYDGQNMNPLSWIS